MTTGEVVSPHTAASAAGRRVLADGGGALDAAVATALALTVVYPHNCSLGGDLFAVVEQADGRRHAINASGRAALATDVDEVRRRFGRRMPITGPATVTVPGLVSGLAALHARGGVLPWSRLFTDAVGLAEDGFPLAGSLAAALRDDGDSLLADPGLRGVFGRDGRPLSPGAHVVQPALAATLRAIAADGPDVLYRGAVGERLVAGLSRLGSPLRGPDLAEHRVDVGAPLHVRFGATDVHTCSPNSQGFVLLQILSVVAALGLTDPLGADVAGLARVLRRTAQERARHLADPDLMTVTAEELLAPDYVAALAADVAGGGELAPAPRAQGAGDTVAVVAADSAGNRVSLIQSLFHSFGARILEPDTGVVLQNRGCAFSLDPDEVAVLAPGRRPPHTLTPLLAATPERSLVIGTMGGKAQPQILTQVLLRLLDGASPAVAVGAPRWVVGGMEVGQPEDTVHLESDVPAATRDRLAGVGWPVVVHAPHSEELGHAHAIRVLGGEFAGAADPRSDG